MFTCVHFSSIIHLKGPIFPSWYACNEEVIFQNIPEHVNLESLEITLPALDTPATESNLTINAFHLLAFLFITERHREGEY